MSNEHLDLILAVAAARGLAADAAARRQLAVFVERLLTENEYMDLTAITDPEGVAWRHFADSWTLLPELDAAAASGAPSLLDVGSGAGFPGLALKIARPGWRVTLLDSQKKRVDFLNRTIETIGLDGVEAVWGRAEELARDSAYRDRFDFVTARAVASLPVVCELCLPFVRAGGRFAAMRGRAEYTPASVRELAAVHRGTVELDLAGMERRLVIFEKTKATPARFPRTYAAILKRPLFRSETRT